MGLYRLYHTPLDLNISKPTIRSICEMIIILCLVQNCSVDRQYPYWVFTVPLLSVHCTITGCFFYRHWASLLPSLGVSFTVTGCLFYRHWVLMLQLQGVYFTLTKCSLYPYWVFIVPLLSVPCTFTVYCSLTKCCLCLY